MSFAFDLDAEIQKLSSTLANLANSANPAVEVSNISRVSRWTSSNHNIATPDTLPDPDKLVPFNQAAMDRIKAGEPVRVWSGVLGEWLHWVRGEPERKALINQSIEPGRIYTLGELAVIAGWTAGIEDRRNALRDVHAMKRDFGATIDPR